MTVEKMALKIVALRAKIIFKKHADTLTVIVDYDKEVTEQIYRFTGEPKDTCIPPESFKDKVYANIIQRLFDSRKKELGATAVHLAAVKWDLVKHTTMEVRIKFEMPDTSLWIFENLDGKIEFRPSLLSIS